MTNGGYRWPEGKSSATMISIDVDADMPLLWRQRNEPTSPYLSELEQRRHGLRAGLPAIRAVLARHGIKATFFVPGLVAERNPEVLPGLVAEGHEVALHGYAHEAVRETPDAAFSEALERSHALFAMQTGAAPRGFRAPGWEMTGHMLAELKRLGLYDSSLAGLDVPYSIAGVTELPISWSREDTVRFKQTGLADRFPPTPPQLVLDEWLFDWQATADAGGLFTLTLHDWISGRPAPLRVLDRLLTEVVQDGRSWIATGAEIAAHHGRVAADAS